MIETRKLAPLRRRFEAVQQELSQPGTASDRKRHRALMEEFAHLQKVEACSTEYERLLRDAEEGRALLREPNLDEDLRVLAEAEIERCDAALPAAERTLLAALLPPRPEDHRNTIAEIRAGTGGEEAALFAGDLYRMYARFAEQRGWKVEWIAASPAGAGGFKEIICSIQGDKVFRTLRYESGVHRVQRIPTTEASGRVHTSAATVAILPEAEEVDVDLRPEELRFDIFRSSGPGGQSVNTTDSAVRITHLPTGLVVTCQDEKSQHRNKDKALRVLRARLLDRQMEQEATRQATVRRAQIGSGDRSERIRTYNFPQNRVTDHRINLTLYHLDRIIEGRLDELVTALERHDSEQRMEYELKGFFP